MIFFVTIYSILALQEPHVKEFLNEASKSGPIKYSFVKPVDCSSGKLKNTYACLLYTSPSPRDRG